jgi:hypothetical protein
MLNNAQKEQICRLKGGLGSRRGMAIDRVSTNVAKSNYLTLIHEGAKTKPWRLNRKLAQSFKKAQ